MIVTERELMQAKFELNQAISERDQAIAELKTVKAAVAWTMGKTQIADLFGTARGEISAASDGYLPGLEPKQPVDDTARLEWVNTHGRVSLGMNGFVIVLPCGNPQDETLPEIYNFRHILDICRKLNS